MNKDEHEIIFLAPPCFGEERFWCQDDAPQDCECPGGPHPWIRYEHTRALEASQAGVGEKLREAAEEVVMRAFDQYRARNGKMCSIEGDDGEKCWIVPFDAMEDLRQALATKENASVDAAREALHPTLPSKEQILRTITKTRWMQSSHIVAGKAPATTESIDNALADAILALIEGDG